MSKIIDNEFEISILIDKFDRHCIRGDVESAKREMYGDLRVVWRPAGFTELPMKDKTKGVWQFLCMESYIHWKLAIY